MQDCNNIFVWFAVSIPDHWIMIETYQLLQYIHVSVRFDWVTALYPYDTGRSCGEILQYEYCIWVR